MATERQTKQIELAEELQDMLLQDFKRLFNSGEATPTDRATLARLLSGNGWVLDPAAIPQGLASKLTAGINAEDLDDDDIRDIRQGLSAA